MITEHYVYMKSYLKCLLYNRWYVNGAYDMYVCRILEIAIFKWKWWSKLNIFWYQYLITFQTTLQYVIA